MQVELLSYNEKWMEILYLAFRQCYSKEFVGSEDFLNNVTEEQMQKFINKVLESGHESPVEHINFTFAIDGVSRAFSHQHVRHRLASYSQQSQRYVSAEDFEYVIPPAIAKIPEALDRFILHMQETSDAYRDIANILRKNGRGNKAEEDARFVLPNAAVTKIVFTMNARTLHHYFNERCCMRAQWEIRNVANEMLKKVIEVAPTLFHAAGAKCERLGYCPEGEKFCCGKYPIKGYDKEFKKDINKKKEYNKIASEWEEKYALATSLGEIIDLYFEYRPQLPEVCPGADRLLYMVQKQYGVDLSSKAVAEFKDEHKGY